MTELIWDGKYDKTTGKKIAPPRIALPFQTVATVNESADDGDRTIGLFASGHKSEWRNRLIWGEKQYVLPSLLLKFAGQVGLIYIDPPFDAGANFSYTAVIPDDPDTCGDQSVTSVKEPSVIGQKAYRDTWGKTLDSYLKWFYQIVISLQDILSKNDGMYVHLDFHAAHDAKCVLGEGFSEKRFQSEIIYKKTSARNPVGGWGSLHDNLSFYTKPSACTGSRVCQTHNVVKVIDILGNDTTKTLSETVK